MVIAATDVSSVNSRIAREAPSLVNVVDVPEECTFIASSVITRGPLTIAVSTGGVSPAFSRAIRKELENLYGTEVGRYLQFVGAVRKKALAGITDRNKRERFLKDLASERTLHLLRTTGVEAVKKSVEKKLERLRTSG
jgi:precorrin-2 dehydrogenase/sirohydrochlorin ferrochelatase